MRRGHCQPTRVNHAGSASVVPPVEPLFTLSGVTFLADGTLFEPADFMAPVAQGGAVGEARMQTWAAGGSGTGATGAGGGGAHSEDTLPIGATEVVTVGPIPAAGGSGGPSSVGVLVVALGGQSSSGGTPGQGGQAAGGTGAIRFSGGNGNQGAGSQNGGGGAGSTGNGVTGNGTGGGPPNGGYSSLPGAFSAWPGGGGGSTASPQFGRPGLVRVTFQVPSLDGAPRIIDITEYRDTANAVSRVVPAPVDRVAGDLLVLETAIHGTTVCSAAAWATGSLAQVTSTAISSRAFYRIATGDAFDDATVATVGSDHVNAHMYVIRDAAGTAEWTTDSATTGDVVPLPHVNSFGFRPSLCIVSAALTSNNGPSIQAFPPDFEGAMVTAGATTNASAMLVTMWRQFNNVGITPGPFDNSSVQWCAGTLVIPGV